MKLLISPEGSIRCIYSEAISLDRIGQVQIRRGSHVEPTADGRWTADLSPVAGPTLGPYATRSQALAAELAWLNQHWLTPTD